MPAKKIKSLLLLLFSIMSLAYGEDFFKTKEQIIRDAWIKRFSLYINSTLIFNNIGYDSNVNAFEGLEQNDWTADLGFNLGVAWIVRDRFIFKIEENPSYLYFAKTRSERAFNNKFKFKAHSYVGVVNFSYGFRVNYQRTRPSMEFATRTAIKETWHEVSINYGRADNFFINLTLNQGETQFLDDRYQQQGNLAGANNEELHIKIGLNKRIFTSSMMFINYEFLKDRFPRSPERDGTGGKVQVGINFPEIGSITGVLQFGVKYFTPQNPNYKGYFNVVGSGAVSMRFLHRFKLQLSYLRDPIFSVLRQDQYFLNTGLGTGLEYYFSSKVKIGCHYQTGQLLYRELESNAETRNDRIHRVNFLIGIRLFKKMGLGILYSTFRSNSSQEEFDQKHNFVGVYIINEF